MAFIYSYSFVIDSTPRNTKRPSQNNTFIPVRKVRKIIHREREWVDCDSGRSGDSEIAPGEKLMVLRRRDESGTPPLVKLREVDGLMQVFRKTKTYSQI